MTKIHAIRTGLVQVRRAQMESRGKGLARTANMLFDEDWSEWLPIYAWVIEHEEGIILVDTGETSRVHENGYHPSWHPFYRRAVRFSVHPDEEIGPQLRTLGIAPRDVRQVVLTHLHTDHAGGLIHLTGSKTCVSRQELVRASGLGGKIQGYLPHRWPKWWQPEFVRFTIAPWVHFGKACPSPAKAMCSSSQHRDTRRIMYRWWYAVHHRSFLPATPATQSVFSWKERWTA
jgi:N-acyl homoserine lactone hydrolase